MAIEATPKGQIASTPFNLDLATETDILAFSRLNLDFFGLHVCNKTASAATITVKLVRESTTIFLWNEFPIASKGTQFLCLEFPAKLIKTGDVVKATASAINSLDLLIQHSQFERTSN